MQGLSLIIMTTVDNELINMWRKLAFLALRYCPISLEGLTRTSHHLGTGLLQQRFHTTASRNLIIRLSIWGAPLYWGWACSVARQISRSSSGNMFVRMVTPLYWGWACSVALQIMKDRDRIEGLWWRWLRRGTSLMPAVVYSNSTPPVIHPTDGQLQSLALHWHLRRDNYRYVVLIIVTVHSRTVCLILASRVP
jgi:hypothetical protein